MTTHNLLNFLASVLCTAVMLVPGTAAAQDGAQEAQQYFEKGAAFYFEGEYGQALVQFKKGHATLPNALFQYNIALCNLKLERYREALTAAREAERMGGLGEREAAMNRSRIVTIPRIQLATTVADDISASQVVASDPDDGSEDVAVSDGTTPQKSGFGGLGWAGVGFTTVGVGLLVGAVAVEVALQGKWDEFNSVAETGDTERFNELKQQIENRQRTGKVLLYSGIGAGAIGVTLLIAELLTSPKSDNKRVGVFVTPDGSAGVTATLRF